MASHQSQQPGAGNVRMTWVPPEKLVNGGFLKWGYPKIIHFSRIFPYKPSFLGIPIYGNPQMAVIVDVLSQVEGFITMYTAIFNPNSIPSSACYSMEGVGWSNVSGTTSSIDKRSPSETMRYKHPSG